MSTHRVTEPTTSTGAAAPCGSGESSEVNPPQTPLERTSCPPITYESRPCSDLVSRLAMVYQWSLEATRSVRPMVVGIGAATAGASVGYDNEQQPAQEKDR